ncbi:MAG: threonine--tRNA ligase, partial [Chloroflexota bacterium]
TRAKPTGECQDGQRERREGLGEECQGEEEQRQMPEEIDFILDFSLNLLRDFGLSDFQAFLSTKPDGKAIGQDAAWQAAEGALEAALKRAGIPYEVDEGGGAFYGPKIDINVKDAIGRKWQLSTIQFDFNLPERFNLSYIGSDGQEHRPYMIHRALLGSLERFFGVLIEHYAGAFPVWLCPIQAVILPIADRHDAYADQIAKALKAAGIRSEVDHSGDRIGNKIRKAQGQKIPYMLIVGDKEVESDQVAIRLRSGDDLGAKTIPDFVAFAQEAIMAKGDIVIG